MKSSRLTYLFVLLGLSAILSSAVSASDSACESMVCCAPTETAAVVVSCGVTASGQTMACGETSNGGCTCSLQSEPPVSGEVEAPVPFFRYTVQLQVLDEFRFSNRDEVSHDESKPLWTSRDEVYEDDGLLSILTYPNPPPATA